MNIITAGKTDIGLSRKKNEDSFYFSEKKQITIVADGVGGSSSGDIASQFVTNFLGDFFKKIDISIFTKDDLKNLILDCNNELQSKASENKKHENMATTLNILVFSEKKVLIGHVGDTRTYLYNNKKITLLTKDHNVRNYALANNLDLDEVAKKHNLDALTNTMGRKFCKPEIYEFNLSTNQLFLTATDGLYKMLKESDIHNIILSTNDLNSLADKLVIEANNKGGKDNITVVLNKILN